MAQKPKIRVLSIRSLDDIEREIKSIGSTNSGMKIMAPKGVHKVIRIDGVRTPAANIMKQEMLACGGEVATARDVLTLATETTSVLVMGTLKQFGRFIQKLRLQPFGLKEIATQLHRLLEDDSGDRYLSCGEFRLPLGSKTLIMGILNVTPDSFSDGGKYLSPDAALDRALQMCEEGADIIDIGGESSRPGADPVPADEERRRVLPVIELLSPRINKPISIDTYKPDIARDALAAGASMVNDISGCRNPEMISVVAESNAAVVVMHMKGTPKTMQSSPEYEDVIAEISDFLLSAAQSLLDAGVHPDRIILDPGIGFGKRYRDNIEILRRVAEIRSLGYPVLIGTSRKSFIGKALGDLPVTERLEGTAATVAISIMNGVDIVRVHDVKEMSRVAAMTDAIYRS